MAATEEQQLPFTVETFFDSTIGHGSMPDNIELVAETWPIEIAVSKVSVSQISAFKITNFSTDETSTNPISPTIRKIPTPAKLRSPAL